MAKDKKFGKGFFCGILTSAVVVLAGSGMLHQGGWITGADQKEAGNAGEHRQCRHTAQSGTEEGRYKDQEDGRDHQSALS